MPAHTDTASSSLALHRYIVVCATATFVLIFVGGLVTSTGSALAVPDWPLAFGRFIPPLTGGIRFEWGHRLVAGAVSVLTLILAIWTWRREPRRWVRVTAFAALGLIILQAGLGGLTVLMLLPLPLAVAHAAVAQGFFCLMIAMVVFSSRGFGHPSDNIKVQLPRRRPSLTLLAMATTVSTYTQILIGAVMRHLGAGLAIPDFPTSYGRLVPPFYSFAVGINFAHRCGALVVTLLVCWTSVRVIRFYSSLHPLRNAAVLMLVLVALQITLGALTIWSGRAVLPTTAHVAIGAALLGASLALTIRAYELKAQSSPAEMVSLASNGRAFAAPGAGVNSNAAAVMDASATLRGRAVAFIELTKPRVVIMILISALAGFYMGDAAQLGFVLALKMLFGTALAAGGTLALNQYLERDFDALMHRTRMRPLPSGRLQPNEALVFGIAVGLAGIIYLYAEVNPLSASVTSLISLLYLGGYTPMKRFTWLCHMVGAIPGALPPVIGWAAARGTLNIEAFVLFGIMLLWQLPHSLSIARIYQADYARAGLSLLPSDGRSGNPVNAVMITATGVLVGFGTVPTWMGFTGRVYFAVALMLGALMLYRAVRLVWAEKTAAAARNVMRVSLVYLPAVLLMMVLDKV